jgi:hypothetical protein
VGKGTQARKSCGGEASRWVNGSQRAATATDRNDRNGCYGVPQVSVGTTHAAFDGFCEVEVPVVTSASQNIFFDMPQKRGSVVVAHEITGLSSLELT